MILIDRDVLCSAIYLAGRKVHKLFDSVLPCSAQQIGGAQNIGLNIIDWMHVTVGDSNEGCEVEHHVLSLDRTG